MPLLEVQDAVTTPAALAAMPQQPGWAASGTGAQGGAAPSAASPFRRTGEALQILSHLMTIGVPYPVQFMEWWFVAVKRADGEVYFYYLEE